MGISLLYLWMRLVRGSINFFPRRGSSGVRAPNYKDKNREWIMLACSGVNQYLKKLHSCDDNGELKDKKNYGYKSCLWLCADLHLGVHKRF